MNSLVLTQGLEARDESGHTHSILIVDDEPRIRTSLRLLLEEAGRNLIECTTGIDAIETLKSRKIDLVLLDINLPDISGLEVLEWINASKTPTSVIFVSADSSIESAIIALRFGAVEFVRKPNELEAIQHKVESALYRRRLEKKHTVMTARLEKSEQMHRFLVEHSPDLIYTLDETGNFKYINKRIETLLGYSREELIGNQYHAIVHSDDLEKSRYAFTERRRDSRATANLEVRLKFKNERYSHFENHHIVAMMSATGIYEEQCLPLAQPQHCFKGTYGVARDITDRKIAEETIAFQAFHDQLTHLPNQRLFKDRLEMAIIHAKRHGTMAGVMFIDLDRFKLVNDTLGHAAGDELLKGMAHRLRQCMRAVDTLARKGGDEFTVLLQDMMLAEDAAFLAEKIQRELNHPFIVAGQEFHVTASIGIAVSPRDGESVDVLLKNADIAMYKVKASGKNGYKFYTHDMNGNYMKRVGLENDLRQAIQNAELELHYQPQYSIRGTEIVGMEALIRWRHPVHGLLNPADFLDLAEETSQISNITDWVLSVACRQLSLWRAMGHDKLRMSVNVSPFEFDRADMCERIIPHITQNHLPHDSLEIEITENILLRDAASVISKMQLLREQGIRISIDDFGTCYSSLNYLRMFPVSTIKIDQSFVHDLAEEHAASPIIQAIVGIARGFGLHLVAEGVETTFQMKALNDLGCDEMQGFYFSRPVPACVAEQLLNNTLLRSPQEIGHVYGQSGGVSRVVN